MGLTIKIGPEAHKKTLSINARRTLDGNIMIYDHPEVDVVIDPRQRKVIIFPKDKMSDDVYDVQNRFFDILTKKGIVAPDTVQGGNVYGALEAIYPSNDKINTLNVVLMALDKFIDEDKTYYIYNDVFEKMERDMLDPDEEDSTELGEVPHEEKQGGLQPGYIYPYGSYGSIGLYRI
tara:strand:- start:1295 stop:1825 length:531 start_codon:yes stop_codon:yes gene_type:complete